MHTHIPENALEVVDLAIKYKDKGVVAVDIAGDETLPMTEEHKAGFLKARENGLCVTVHAGESGPASNVRRVSVCVCVCACACVCVKEGGKK